MSEGKGSIRALTAGMRRLLFIASGLVALAGFQLFVLTDHTDRYFSWTIAIPHGAPAVRRRSHTLLSSR